MRCAPGRFASAALAALAALALFPHAARTGPRPFAVVDLHVDLSYQTNYEGRSFARATRQFPAAELARAGVVGVVLPLFVPRGVSPTGPRKADLESSYARIFGEIAASDAYALPGCLPRGGRVATFLALEGAGQLAGDPDALTAWAARGLRSLGLVHTWANALASSSGDGVKKPFGLTEAGRALVRRAEALGVPVDVSHASDRAARDVLDLAEASGAVVIATHSNARALADHPRNLADAELRRIAHTGGVVGVNFHSAFLARGRPATLGDVVAQVRHLVRVMGPEHVAVGSDFEGDIRPPPELSDVRGYQTLAAALVESGMTEGEVEGIMAKNALRVLCRAGGEL